MTNDMSWEQIEKKLELDYSNSIVYLGDKKQSIINRWGAGLGQAIEDCIDKDKRDIKIHDCTCGTGTQLIGLAQRGFDISGSDRGAGTIQHCKKELEGLKLGATVFQHDCTEPYPQNLWEHYDAAISVNNGNANLILPESIKGGLAQAFKNIYQILKPNGVFLYSVKPLEIYQQEGVLQPHGFKEFEVFEGGLRLKIELRYNWIEKTNEVVSRTKYRVEKECGEVREFSFQTRFSVWLPEEIEKCLRLAGFKTVTTNIVEQLENGYKERWFKAVKPEETVDKCNIVNSSISKVQTPSVEKLDIRCGLEDLKQEFKKNILTREAVFNGSFYHGWSVLSDNGSYKSGFHHGSSVYTNLKEKTVFNKEQAEKIQLRADTDYNRPTEICRGVFANLIARLTEMGFAPCRARIIGLPPGKSTNWHRDHRDGFYWVRLHIPLITNSQCFFITEHDKTHMPADGSAYLVNTAQMHMAVNEGDSHRYHFICQVWDRQGHSKNFPYKDKKIRIF